MAYTPIDPMRGDRLGHLLTATALDKARANTQSWVKALAPSRAYALKCAPFLGSLRAAAPELGGGRSPLKEVGGRFARPRVFAGAHAARTPLFGLRGFGLSDGRRGRPTLSPAPLRVAGCAWCGYGASGLVTVGVTARH